MFIESINDHELKITITKDQAEVIKIALRQFANMALRGMPNDAAKTPEEKAALKEDKKIAAQIHNALAVFEVIPTPN